MKVLLLLLSLVSFKALSFPVTNERIIEADQIKVLDSTYVTLKNDIDMDANNIFGITDLTVTGTTTLDTGLTGVAKLLSGVVGVSNVILTSEVSGVLPVANGGTNSSAALANDLVIISNGGSLIESATTSTELSYLDATSSVQTQIDSKQPNLPLSAVGDLLIYNGGFVSLPYVLDGKFLGSVGGLPAWVNAPISTTLTLKGQLQGFSTVNTNVGPCADNQILLYDNVEATGWKCSALPSTSPTTTLGDIIVRGAVADEALPIGDEGQVPTVVGGTLVYEDAAAGDVTNVLLNPQFEKDGDDWTIAGGCVASYPVTAPLGKTLRLTCTAATFSVKQLSTSLVPFAGQQAAFDVQVKSDASGVKVSSINNSIRNTSYDVIGDDTFKRFKQIGVIADAVNNGLEIYSDVAFTGVVDIDNTYLGLSNLTQEIANISKWESYTPTGSWTTNTIYTGKYRIVGDTIEVQAKIANTGAPNNVALTVNIPTEFTIDTSKRVHSEINTDILGTVYFGSSGIGDLVGHVLYSTDTAVAIQSSVANAIYTYLDPVNANAPNGSLTNGDYITAHFSVPVNELTAPSSTVVTQNAILTAETDNELSGKVDLNGNMDSQKYTDSGITSTRNGLGTYTIDYSSLGLTTIPTFDVQAVQNSVNLYVAVVRSETLTEAIIDIKYTTNIFGDADFSWFLTKQGADVNKSVTLKGDFAQIKSDDLVKVIATSATSISFPSGTTTLDYDLVESGTNLKGYYNSATGVFTNPDSKKYYHVCTTALFASSAWSAGQYYNLRVQKSVGGNVYVQENTVNSAGTYYNNLTGCVDISLEPNETFIMVLAHNSSTKALHNSAQYNRLTITEQATQESIVANIMQGQVETCETKTLSAASTSVGTLGDLTFSTDIGSVYKFSGQFVMSTLGNIKARDSGVDKAEVYNGTVSTMYQAMPVQTYKATGTSFYIHQNSTATVNSNGLLTGTWVQLCKQPETTIIK